MQKKGARYLRFSDDSQNVGSLDRQDIVTNQWCKNNDVMIMDTFKDDGYSARTFDRPDVQKLFDFIKRNHKVIDYLVVAELVAANSGLGYAILKAQRFLQTDKIFAGIILIGLIGLVTDQLFRLVHRKSFPWLYRK